MALTREKQVFLVVFAALFVDIAGFSMILPLFPAILDYFATQPPQADELFTRMNRSLNAFREAIGAPELQRWNSVLFGGALGSLFSLLQFAASPVFGSLSDVFGRKRILLLTYVGSALGCAQWAAASSFTQFVVARVICGLAKGSTGIYSAIVTDVSLSETRNVGMVIVGLAYSLGFIVGPMCGAWLSAYVRTGAATGSEPESGRFFVLPASVALGLTILDLLLIVVFLGETNRSFLRRKGCKTEEIDGPTVEQSRDLSKKAHGRLKETLKLIEPVSLFRFSALRGVEETTRSVLRRFGLSYFLFLVLFSGIEFNLTFLAATRFNYDSLRQGKMFVFMGVLMVLIQGGVVRRVRAGNERRFAAVGMLAVLPSGLLLAFSTTQLHFYSALAVFTFASASVVPCMTTCVSRFGAQDEKGKLLGILRSLGALARAIGPLLFASIYWMNGVEVAYTVAALSMLAPVAILCSIPRSFTTDYRLNKED